VITHLGGKKNMRIAEIGGGDSRVLKRLAVNNECWNIDKFEGLGQGPATVPIGESNNIKIIKSYMGEFSKELPVEYFDFVFSISVVEHVPNEKLKLFFQDIERILKPGGLTIHAIDHYLTDNSEDGNAWTKYAKIVSDACMLLVSFEKMELSSGLKFSAKMASDPDMNMWKRNNLVPKHSSLREKAQCVSIQAGWKKNVIEHEPSCVEEILIYQMGKVASSTINKTLKKYGLKTKHFHYFEGDFNSSDTSARETFGVDRIEGHKIRIITLTRDPVARNISAFFQNIDKFIDRKLNNTNIVELIEVFFNKYNQGIPLKWFDDEFMINTGIDIYSYKFDKKNGYTIIEKNNVKTLIMKSEISDDEKLFAIRTFLGSSVRIEKLHRSNVASEKVYGNIYNDFMKSIVFSELYLDKMYNSKYTTHFYTSDEIDKFRNRWIKK
jgi:hypothetical protein